MKFNMKVVAASVLFAVAGSSQAAILSGFAGAGDGELFLSIFRDNASPESMIIDTNVSLFDLRNGTVTGWTSSASQTAAILSFLGTSSLSDFRFNAGGVTDTTDFFDPTLNADGGFFVSTNTTLTPATAVLDGSGLETVRSNINAFEVQINNAYASTDVVTGLNPGEAGFHNSLYWGNNVGGTFVNTEASVGTSLSLWNGYNGSPDFLGYELAYSLIGQLNIDTITGVATLSTAPVSAVPVPAAAWLLGSGLMGLVGVARRKAA